jgi:hypothetical protein
MDALPPLYTAVAGGAAVLLSYLYFTYRPRAPLRTNYTVEVPELESKPGHGVPRRTWRSPDKLKDQAIPNVATIYDLIV